MTPAVTPRQRGFNMLVDTRYGMMLCNRHDIYVSQGGLIAYGEYSELEIQFVRQFLSPGSCVIQVGAHIGSLTVPLAQAVGSDGMLIAFEPQRLPFQLLCANVALASLEHVMTVNAAVGNEVGGCVIEHTDPNAPCNTGGVRVNATTKGETVRMVTLDSFCGPRRFDLLHADVEGMEEEVLRGAATLIQRHRPVLYVEAIDADRRPSLFAFMRSLGYRLWHHDPPMYNPDNYAGLKQNMLGGVVSVNILGWPAEKEIDWQVDSHTREVTE